MNPNLRLRWAIRVVVMMALILMPFFVNEFRVSLVAQMLVFGLAAAALNVLVGVAGLPSLGHAAFLGLGSYSAGLTAVHLSSSVWVGLAFAIIIGAAFALVAGMLSVRTSGIAFLMLSLAIAQIMFSISDSWRDVTGGSDGLRGIPNPSLFPGFELDSVALRYYYMVGIFALGYYFLRRLVDSPVGWALRGITSNPERMSSLGYNVPRYRLFVCVIVGIIGAVAGAINVQFSRFASPENFGFGLSAFLLIIVFLGGMKRLHGALIGAAILVWVRQELSSEFGTWEFGVGAILVIVIYLLPGGLAGLAERIGVLSTRRKSKLEQKPSDEERAIV